MDLFIISDIYGRTRALEELCTALGVTGGHPRIIDPYNGRDLEFDSQDDAYDCFMQQPGLDGYAAHTCKILSGYKAPSKETDCLLIGFSVGASAIWQLSESKELPRIKKAFCYYGSQIRKNTGIKPAFDIELIFPAQEPHFNVNGLIGKLTGVPRTNCRKTKGCHGFMNQLSPGFHPDLYQTETDYLVKSISGFMTGAGDV